MKIRENKQFYIYVPVYEASESLEPSSYEKVEVSEEVYKAFYQPIWREHDHAKRKGGCTCADWKRCYGDCGTCKYHTASKVYESFESMFEDETKDRPDPFTNVESTVTETLLQAKRLEAIQALDPESQFICRAIAEGKNERDAAQELGLSKTTYHDRKQRLLARLRDEWADIV